MEVQEKINNIIITCGHIVTRNFPVMMMKIKSLASTFEKKGMGPTTNVLGIKVIMNKDANSYIKIRKITWRKVLK